MITNHMSFRQRNRTLEESNTHRWLIESLVGFPSKQCMGHRSFREDADADFQDQKDIDQCVCGVDGEGIARRMGGASI